GDALGALGLAELALTPLPFLARFALLGRLRDERALDVYLDHRIQRCADDGVAGSADVGEGAVLRRLQEPLAGIGLVQGLDADDPPDEEGVIADGHDVLETALDPGEAALDKGSVDALSREEIDTGSFELVDFETALGAEEGGLLEQGRARNIE